MGGDVHDEASNSKPANVNGRRSHSRPRPLAARSVVLSLLLGTHPPELPVRQIVRATQDFGISEATLRVALSRMVAAGDLVRDDASNYRLSARLIERQRRQDAAIDPRLKGWRGNWEMVVVTATGRGAAERAELRTTLTALRLAELREGVWLRPANLRRELAGVPDGTVDRFLAKPDEDPVALARRLWALDEWAREAEALLRQFDTHDAAARFTTAAAIVRHLLLDPVLPEALLPAEWPGARLRTAYAGYQAELIERGYGAREVS